VVEAAGLRARIADTAALAAAAMDEPPALVVVDLHAAGIDVMSVIRMSKAAGAAVLAFGRHTEPATLRAARDAGADAAVSRSQLVDELPELIARLIARDSGTAAAS
jgi:DNA-binding NarL/FixJ family response regulator